MNDVVKAGLAGCVGTLAVLGAVGLAAGAGPFGAATTLTGVASPEVAALRLDFGRQLAPSRCEGVGSPIVNVAQSIKNDADSGQAGNYWGFDTFTRTIQLWKTSTSNVFCAVVRYQGSFVAEKGQTSPGNTGVLSGDERGPIQGGYAAAITGTLLTQPLWPLKGNVGVTDYQCDLSGNCPGAITWVGQYFNPDYSFDYSWWGWIYRAGAKHTWVNSSEGNSGDVL